MALSSENFLVGLADEINRMTGNFVHDGYQALATALKVPLASCIVLYIVLVGYAMIRGKIDKPQDELWKFSLKVGAIYMLAMNWNMFALYIRDFFVSGSELVATLLLGLVHSKAISTSINQSLQNVLNEVLALGSILFEASSVRKITPLFAGVLVLLSGCATVGLAFIEIVIARFMLSLILCTAPLFIIFILFEQTKSLFERWLSMLISYSLVLVFVSAVAGLCAHLTYWVTAMALGDTAPTAAIWIPLFLVACLCVMTVSQASSLGKSIGGAFHAAGGTSMVQGFASNARNTFDSARKTFGNNLGKTADMLQTATTANPGKLAGAIQKNLRTGAS